MIRLPLKINVEMPYEHSIPPVNVRPVVSTLESEVLISDSLAEKLRIVIESPGKGLWRFKDERPGKTRTSEKPQYWT